MTNDLKMETGSLERRGVKAWFRSAFVTRLKEQLPLSLLVLAVFLLVILSGVISANKIQNDGNIYLAVMAVELGVFVLPAMLFCRFRGMDFIKDTNLRFIGFSKLPTVVFALLFLIFSNILITLMLYSGASPTDTVNTTVSVLPPDNPDVVGVIITFAIVPALCEEFLFRCVLMSEFKKYGYFTAVVITSLLFSMVHFSVGGFLIYFFSGLVLGAVAYITRSVVASMLVHILYNLYGLFAESEVWGAISRNVNIVLVVFIAVVVVLISLMVALGEAQRLFLDYSVTGIKPPEGYINPEEVENADQLIKKRRIKALLLFANPAFIIACLTFLGVIIFTG